VTLADPVLPEFLECTLLTRGRSIDHASVTLPTRAPVVNIILYVPRTPCDVWHRTDDSEHHSVDSHAVSIIRIASVYVVSPKLVPCTVTLADPVPARFRRVVKLRLGSSIDHASVTVPTRSPAVNIIRRVPLTPCDDRQWTDVSDHHSVDSHAVSMIRIASVYVVIPKLVPCTVTLADPVPARFRPVMMLSAGISIDHASVTVPTRSPAVNIIRRDPRTPWLVRHRTDVSDHHSDASHAVSITRIASVYAVSPKFVPCTVTLADPVPARFRGVLVLSIGESIDHTSVTVPTRSPTVNITGNVPRTPCDVRQRTDDSDHHSVDSHAVSITRIAFVYVVIPKLIPCTVTLADPVPARFTRVMMLSIGESINNASVTVPTRSPVVNIIRGGPRNPCDVRQRIDDSDHHSDASHAVSMIRIASVYVVRPKLVPCTVMLADPVPARFRRVGMLRLVRSIDHASVSVPTRPPVVSII
jgi:hypothetical protein